MDDIASKLTELLSDPEGMKKISDIATSFISDKNKMPEKKPTNFNLNDMQIDPIMMGNIMRVMSAMKSQNNDDKNARLLLALKPHLQEERQRKVDKAISILKIVNIMPVLKESGILNLLGEQADG